MVLTANKPKFFPAGGAWLHFWLPQPLIWILGNPPLPSLWVDSNPGPVPLAPLPSLPASPRAGENDCSPEGGAGLGQRKQ